MKNLDIFLVEYCCVCFVAYVCISGVNGAIVPAAKENIHKNLESDLKGRCNTNDDCAHGVCDLKNRVCRCIGEWRGIFCDIHISDVHSTGTPGTKTRTNGADVIGSVFPTKQTQWIPEPYPIEDRNVSLSENRKRMLQFQKLNDEATTEFTSIKVTTSTDNHQDHDRHRHVCTGYKKRDLKERMCLPGLICTFGTCSSKRHNAHISFECECDPGAIGLFCEHKCCLDCSGHGRCALYSNGSEFCDCALHFHGEKCEISNEGQVISSSHSKISLIITVGLSVISALLLLAVMFLFLILRDRGCMALMALPIKCKHSHAAEPRGSATDSVLVFYHGGNPLPTIASSSANMTIQSLPDLVKCPGVPNENDKETPSAHCTHGTDIGNQMGMCMHEAHTDNTMLQYDIDNQTVLCINEANNDKTMVQCTKDVDNDVPRTVCTSQTDDYSGARGINGVDNDVSGTRCTIEVDNDVSGTRCTLEVDRNVSGASCTIEVDRNMSGTSCTNQIDYNVPGKGYTNDADNYVSGAICTRTNEVDNDMSGTRCTSEVDNDKLTTQ